MVIEHRGDHLIGRRDFHDIIKPTLKALVRRLGPSRHSLMMRDALGKWLFLCHLSDQRPESHTETQQAFRAGDKIDPDDQDDQDEEGFDVTAVADSDD
eukprot:6181498-Amphidinium_carterae.1